MFSCSSCPPLPKPCIRPAGWFFMKPKWLCDLVPTCTQRMENSASSYKINYRLLLSLDTLGRQHSNNSEIFYYSDFVSFATAHSQPELLFSYIALGQASHAPQPDSTTQDGVASASASCFEVLLHKSHKAQPLCSLCRQREHT